MTNYQHQPFCQTAFWPDVLSDERDEEEGSCTKMIYALLLLDHSYTLFNGLNELTKYTEHSSLNINQG